MSQPEPERVDRTLRLVDSAVAEEARRRAQQRASRADAVGALVELSEQGDAAAVQDLLTTLGARLLAHGRARELRDVIATIPPAERRPLTNVVDAMAALALDQIVHGPDGFVHLTEADLDALEPIDELDVDLQIAAHGLRSEYFRTRGDVRMVAAALEAIARLGRDVDHDPVDRIVAGRSPLARRGTFHALHNLGFALMFSGDPAAIAVGRRYTELGFDVADRCGVDVVVLRGQAAYGRVQLGVDAPWRAIAPLEASSASLRRIGHPEAANHLVQLAHVLQLHGDLDEADAVADDAESYARSTANDLVLPSIALVRAGVELIREGPRPDLDRRLAAAWEAQVASPRLRRVLPTIAARVAVGMIDALDLDRARAWHARGVALLERRVQADHQRVMLELVERRIAFVGAPAGTMPDDTYDAPELAGLEAGLREIRAVNAWDRLRRGDPAPAAAGLGEPDFDLGPVWESRLRSGAASVAPHAAAPGPDWRVLLLAPACTVEPRDGGTVAPSGKLARLLALIVLRDGRITVDAACDALWPDADLTVARNRLHQLLLRLRRQLGDDAGDAIGIVDGAVRLDRARFASDVWDLRTCSINDRNAMLAVVEACRAPLCDTQFAYDEAFDDHRYELSYRIAELCTRLLAGDGVRDPRVRGVVDAARQRMPAEDRIAEVYADALDRVGDHDEAALVRELGLQRLGL